MKTTITNRYNYKDIKVFHRGMIMGLTKSLSQLRFGNYDAPRGEGNAKMIERAKTFGLEIDYNDSNLPGEKFLFKTFRKITNEQTKFGKAWLKNHFFKLNGEKRTGKNTEYVNDDVLRIAKAVVKFEFVGVLGVANQSWEIHSFLPIYRAYNKKGEYFDYSPVHWGQPVIMDGAT